MVYPSVINIDLAIERMLLNRCLLRCVYQRTKFNIDDFRLPSYTLDIGHVVLLTPMCCTIRIKNQCFEIVDVKLDKKPKPNYNLLEFDDFKIEFRYRHLHAGDTIEIFLLFKPTRRRYGLQESKVENTFAVSLKQGGNVPIKILAVVTMPKLTFHQSLIDFGEVIIGEAIRKSMLVVNE